MRKCDLLPREEAAIVKGCKSFFVAAYNNAHLTFHSRIPCYSMQSFLILQSEKRLTLIALYTLPSGLLHLKDAKMDELYDQWTESQLLPNESFGTADNRIDKVWSKIAKERMGMKNSIY